MFSTKTVVRGKRMKIQQYTCILKAYYLTTYISSRKLLLALINFWHCINYKKVLLRERNRHTAHRIASTHCPVISSSSPNGGGYPIQSQSLTWMGGYPLLWPSMGYPPSWPGMGYPLPSGRMGNPLSGRMGVPPSARWGTPPPQMLTDIFLWKHNLPLSFRWGR